MVNTPPPAPLGRQRASEVRHVILRAVVRVDQPRHGQLCPSRFLLILPFLGQVLFEEQVGVVLRREFLPSHDKKTKTTKNKGQFYASILYQVSNVCIWYWVYGSFRLRYVHKCTTCVYVWVLFCFTTFSCSTSIVTRTILVLTSTYPPFRVDLRLNFKFHLLYCMYTCTPSICSFYLQHSILFTYISVLIFTHTWYQVYPTSFPSSSPPNIFIFAHTAVFIHHNYKYS